MDQAPPKKMAPGDDMHLTLLMAPHNLNLVTGQDRQHLLAFGRAAFEAGQYATKDNMLLAVIAENERLNAQLTTASQLLQQMLAEFGRDGHGGEFEDGEHPLIDEVRAFLTGTPYAVRTKQSRAWRIYIAGPMTGLPDLNFPAFNAAADELRNQGWHVENPAAHGVIDGAQWEDYLAYDITRLGTCGAIYLLPGWEKSKGATLEAHIAKMLGLQVLLAPGAEDVQPLRKTVAAQQGVPVATRYRFIIGGRPHEWRPGDVEMMDNPLLLVAQKRGEIEMHPLYTHPTPQGLDAQAIERAAQKLADIAEYNWVQLTEKQREEFRTDALSALTAALGLGHE